MLSSSLRHVITDIITIGLIRFFHFSHFRFSFTNIAWLLHIIIIIIIAIVIYY